MSLRFDLSQDPKNCHMEYISKAWLPLKPAGWWYWCCWWCLGSWDPLLLLLLCSPPPPSLPPDSLPLTPSLSSEENCDDHDVNDDDDDDEIDDDGVDDDDDWYLWETPPWNELYNIIPAFLCHIIKEMRKICFQSWLEDLKTEVTCCYPTGGLFV